MKLSFIQLRGFATNWARLRLSDDDLRSLEDAILAAPGLPPVMRGTGGLRKIRFSPGRSQRGKSGALRVCYAFFPEFGLVYLCAVFAKSQKANLSATESEQYRTTLSALAAYLRRNWQKGWTP
jgi:hypothetical protein